MLKEIGAFNSNKIVMLYAFLLPALLLTTPNWSVGVTILLIIHAIVNFKKMGLTRIQYT